MCVDLFKFQRGAMEGDPLLLRAVQIETHRLSRWMLACALTLVLLCLFVVYARKAAENASAIIRWRGLIENLVRGENVYNNWLLEGSFPGPPILGLALWPLTRIPPLAAALTWLVLKIVMAAISVHWSAKIATAGARTLSLAGLAVLLALAGRPLLSDLQHGNINILILFLTTAGLLAYVTGRDALAGLAIALAAAFKLTPALFIPYFAYKREWRVVGWSVIGLALFLVVVPGTMLGFERNWWLLRSWAGAMVWPYVVHGQVETLQVNQSLAGVLFRLLTASPGLELSGNIVQAINWLNLSHETVFWILKLVVATLLGGLACLCRTPTGDRFDRRIAVEFSLVFVAMLLVSERSWKHHFVTMLLPYCVLVTQLHWASKRPPQDSSVEMEKRGQDDAHWCPLRAQRWIGASLVLCFLMMASTSNELAGWLVHGHGHKYAQAYGLFCASALTAFVVLALILRTAHSAASRTMASESCAAC